MLERIYATSFENTSQSFTFEHEGRYIGTQLKSNVIWIFSNK